MFSCVDHVDTGCRQQNETPIPACPVRSSAQRMDESFPYHPRKSSSSELIALSGLPHRTPLSSSMVRPVRNSQNSSVVGKNGRNTGQERNLRIYQFTTGATALRCMLFALSLATCNTRSFITNCCLNRQPPRTHELPNLKQLITQYTGEQHGKACRWRRSTSVSLILVPPLIYNMDTGSQGCFYADKKRRSTSCAGNAFSAVNLTIYMSALSTPTLYEVRRESASRRNTASCMHSSQTAQNAIHSSKPPFARVEQTERQAGRRVLSGFRPTR